MDYIWFVMLSVSVYIALIAEFEFENPSENLEEISCLTIHSVLMNDNSFL